MSSPLKQFLLRVSLLFVTFTFILTGLGIGVVHGQTNKDKPENYDVYTYKVDSIINLNLPDRLTRLEEDTKQNSTLITMNLSLSMTMIAEMGYRLYKSKTGMEE